MALLGNNFIVVTSHLTEIFIGAEPMHCKEMNPGRSVMCVCISVLMSIKD